MANEFGLRCPQCGNTDLLNVELKVWLPVDDDGVGQPHECILFKGYQFEDADRAACPRAATTPAPWQHFAKPDGRARATIRGQSDVQIQVVADDRPHLIHRTFEHGGHGLAPLAVEVVEDQSLH